MPTNVHSNPVYWLVISLAVILQTVRGELSNSTGNSNYTKTIPEANLTTPEAPTQLNDNLGKEGGGKGGGEIWLLSTISVQNSTSGNYEVLTKGYVNSPVAFHIIIGASIGGAIILVITLAYVCCRLNRKTQGEKSKAELTDNEHLRRIENSFSLQMEKQVVLLQTSDLMKFQELHKDMNRKLRSESEDEGVHSVDEDELCFLQQHTLLKAPRRPKPPSKRRLPAKYKSYFERSVIMDSNRMKTSKSMPESAKLNEDSSSSDYLSRSETFDSELANFTYK